MPMPTPHNSESETNFVKRAHEALAAEFPDSKQRNAVVFKLWRDAHGESDAEKAAHSRFNADEFSLIENVPHFKEHDYPWMPRQKDGKPLLDDDGQPVVRNEHYDFEAMNAICENLNERIADTGDFSPITDRHNKNAPGDHSKPGILGFAGPYGLGMVGNKEPKWAVIAKQEHWFSDKAHLARELPRRSAEVYLGRPMHQRILDPVTALGADTPALDMGIHYSQDQTNGELIACYSGPPILAQYSFDESKHPRAEAGEFTTAEDEAGMDHAAHSKRALHHTREAQKHRMFLDFDKAIAHDKAVQHHHVMAAKKGPGLKDPKPIRSELVPKSQYDAAACFPGGQNTFVPSEVEVRKKKTYAEGEQEPAQPDAATNEGKSMISPEDAAVLVKAWMETEPMQWVIRQMEADKAPKAEQPGEKPGLPGVPPPAAPPVGPPQKQQLSEEESPQVDEPPDQMADDDSQPDEGEPSPEKKKDDEMPENDKAKYAEREEVRDLVAKYSALEASNAALLARCETLETQAKGADGRATMALRVQKLNEYRSQGFDMDIAEETQRCSLEKMDEARFQDHLDLIVHHYQRIPINVGIFTPDEPLIEDRHKAQARSNTSPAFTETEEFRDEVVAYAQALQEKPDWVPTQSFYSECRQAVIDRRSKKAAPVTKAS